MLFSHYLHYTYLMEKMSVNVADAVGILKFLEKKGHDVGFPAPEIQYEECRGEGTLRTLA